MEVLDAVAEKLKPGGASRSEPNDEADAMTRYSLDRKEMRNRCLISDGAC
ncbi:hypothetical protein SynBIOSE41_02856 [Synechococcus sp. BIOS-E4-1]|nr:hypothetical protein SynBIOSE41_02856 [Synechococcus sp. BIOS-E4-1]